MQVVEQLLAASEVVRADLVEVARVDLVVAAVAAASSASAGLVAALAVVREDSVVVADSRVSKVSRVAAPLVLCSFRSTRI